MSGSGKASAGNARYWRGTFNKAVPARMSSRYSLSGEFAVPRVEYAPPGAVALTSPEERKVLIIVENSPVPPDPRVLSEARSLIANGYEVTVLSPRGKRYLQGYEVVNGIRIYRHPTPREGHTPLGYLWEYGCALFWEFLYTSWIFLRHGFHVIQACNPPDNIFLVVLPFKLFGVKFIFDHHDACPELYMSKYGQKTFLYKLQLWLERMTFRFSDAVMATNVSYKDLAINRGRVDSHDVFVVRNGPDPRTFKAVPPNPVWKDGREFLIGYVGSMNFQDGLDILVDVAHHVKNLGRRDIRFVCVGGGPELPALKRMVQDRDLADTIHFTGRVPDAELLEILSTADVCVNPDRPCEMNNISTMIKVLEYMALGKPIVQFDSKEGRFSAQEASLYAAGENHVADFASKILWLLERPEERKRMGEEGRRRIEKELAWEYSVENLLGAYQRAFSKRQQAKGLTTHEPARTPVDRPLPIATNGESPAAGAIGAFQVERHQACLPYVLITPARNEEAFIEKTIESMIRQTVPPVKWVIVDDGSTDQTPQIVSRYLADHPWIELVRMPQHRDRNFAGKVGAFNAGYQRVEGLPFEIIGNLDADISFDDDHFEFLVRKFSEDHELGVGGTVFREEGYSSDVDSFEGHNHVPGGCQLFRKACFEEIGRFIPHRHGGVDWIAVTTARMMGWKTQSFREKSFFHHRHLGMAERNALAAQFSYGEKDYYLGGHVVWEFFRVVYRATKHPFSGIALGLGYCWALFRRAPRSVSQELMNFHRQEQIAKLKAIFKSLVRFKRVDSFDVQTN